MIADKVIIVTVSNYCDSVMSLLVSWRSELKIMNNIYYSYSMPKFT